jgi:hypothetical protein
MESNLNTVVPSAPLSMLLPVLLFSWFSLRKLAYKAHLCVWIGDDRFYFLDQYVYRLFQFLVILGSNMFKYLNYRGLHPVAGLI